MQLSISDFSPQEIRKSTIVFSIFSLLVVLGVSFPEVPAQGLHGVLWTGLGLLMFCLPPTVRTPRVWSILALGFIVLSFVGFLPRTLFSLTPWRLEVEQMGAFTGSTAYIQPQVAIQFTIAFAITAITALYLLGHRIHSSSKQWITLAFSIAMALWVIFGLILQKKDAIFGFFPNRNHTATLLSMAVFVGMGGLAHAVRHRKMLIIGILVPCILLPLWVLFAVSISRAGIILIGLGGLLWFVLAGRNNLRGNAGKAIALLAIAAVGVFFVADSRAKERLSTATHGLTAPSGDMQEAATAAASRSNSAVLEDGRWMVFQDTWDMIRHEIWTGVGPGQFAYAIPQYRKKLNSFKFELCVHPESDWIWMLAEVGWPATICIAGAVMCAVVFATKKIRTGKGRLLRVGCLVSALLLLAHGLFDVPGHRIGIAWAGLLFLALSMQGIVFTSKDSWAFSSTTSRNIWRCCGFLLTVGGVTLIVCQATGKYVLPQERANHHGEIAHKLFLEDEAAYKTATSQGLAYNPLPAECPIEKAIDSMNQALEITPLDSYLIFGRGKLAVYLDDKEEMARKDFALQQRLDPHYSNVGIYQSYCWSVTDLDETIASWKRSLAVAAKADPQNSHRYNNLANTYLEVIRAGYTMLSIGDIFSHILELAEGNHALRVIWVKSIPSSILDREMPKVLLETKADHEQQDLFKHWQPRANKDLLSEFLLKHPELGPVRP